MKDTDFADVDEWGEYEPTQNEKLKKEVTNPDIFPLRRNTEFQKIEGLDKDEFEEYVTDQLDEDDEDDYIPFRKSGEYEVDNTFSEGKSTVTMFDYNDGDYIIFTKTFLGKMTKGKKNYFVYIDHPTNSYRDGDKLTMTGWDCNIIVDMSDMTFKRKNVR